MKETVKNGSDIYLSEKVGSIKLNNQCGAVVKLECYQKKNPGDSPQRVGQTGSFPVGQNKTLHLDDLNLKNGILVTVYVNVVAGKDDHATTWVIYEEGNKRTAEYTISGVINFTSVAFNGVNE